MNNVESRVQEVVIFNSLLGRYDNITQQDLAAQARVCREEALEVYEAVTEGHTSVDVLKECVDLLVVAHGFAAMLIRQGHDVSGAWKVVNDNNMTKMCSNPIDAHYTQVGYASTEDQIFEVKQLDYNKWGVFDSHGKLRKPIGYEKVDLTEFTAEAKENRNEGIR